MFRFAIISQLGTDPTSADGCFDLGQDDFTRSAVRILDIGGLIWESDQHYETVAGALDGAERALTKWVELNLQPKKTD